MKKGRKPILSADEVRVIRRWYDQWCRIPRPAQVAKRFKVSRSNLEHIVNGSTYRWVE